MDRGHMRFNAAVEKTACEKRHHKLVYHSYRNIQKYNLVWRRHKGCCLRNISNLVYLGPVVWIHGRTLMGVVTMAYHAFQGISHEP